MPLDFGLDDSALQASNGESCMQNIEGTVSLLVAPDSLSSLRKYTVIQRLNTFREVAPLTLDNQSRSRAKNPSTRYI